MSGLALKQLANAEIGWYEHDLDKLRHHLRLAEDLANQSGVVIIQHACDFLRNRADAAYLSNAFDKFDPAKAILLFALHEL